MVEEDSSLLGYVLDHIPSDNPEIDSLRIFVADNNAIKIELVGYDEETDGNLRSDGTATSVEAAVMYYYFSAVAKGEIAPIKDHEYFALPGKCAENLEQFFKMRTYGVPKEIRIKHWTKEGYTPKHLVKGAIWKGKEGVTIKLLLEAEGLNLDTTINAFGLEAINQLLAADKS